MSRVDELKAELELAELEAKLVDAKDGDDSKALRKIKNQVRDARQAAREAREV